MNNEMNWALLSQEEGISEKTVPSSSRPPVGGGSVVGRFPHSHIVLGTETGNLGRGKFVKKGQLGNNTDFAIAVGS